MTDKISKCCTCGYEWQTGQHGGHSCADKLSIRISALESNFAQITANMAHILLNNVSLKDTDLFKEMLKLKNSIYEYNTKL